jgi:hypothetical protein
VKGAARTSVRRNRNDDVHIVYHLDEDSNGNNNNNNNNTIIRANRWIQPPLPFEVLPSFIIRAIEQVEFHLNYRASLNPSSKSSFGEMDLRLLLGLFAKWPYDSNVKIKERYETTKAELLAQAVRLKTNADNGKPTISEATVSDRKRRWNELAREQQLAILRGGELQNVGQFVKMRAGAAHLVTDLEAQDICKAVRVLRSKSWAVSTNMVQLLGKSMMRKHRPLHYEVHGDLFSENWARCFMKEHNFRQAAPTTDRTVSLDTIEKDGAAFFRDLQAKRHQYQFNKELVFNMDEFFVTMDTQRCDGFFVKVQAARQRLAPDVDKEAASKQLPVLLLLDCATQHGLPEELAEKFKRLNVVIMSIPKSQTHLPTLRSVHHREYSQGDAQKVGRRNRRFSDQAARRRLSR